MTRSLRRTSPGTATLAVVTVLACLLSPGAGLAAADAATTTHHGSVRTAVSAGSVDRAWTWLQGQRGTGTVPTTTSTITPTTTYAADWTGPVSGSFVVRDVSPQAVGGLVVQAYVVTDTAYLIGQQPASTDGTFAFADSRPGTKMFRLVDSASGDILAEYAPDFGLLRSYGTDGRSYAYDQAIAVVVALDLDHDATQLLNGLLTLQTSAGGFVESADVRNPAAATPSMRTGISAIATYALLRASQAGVGDRKKVTAAAHAGVSWLRAQNDGAGLFTGGSDASGTRLRWISTEHNLDAWHTLDLAAKVWKDNSLRSAAASLSTTIRTRLWMAGEGRFAQGIAPDGSLDTTDALDVSSWGSIFLNAVGATAQAKSALNHTSAFASQVGSATGYRAWYPQPGFEAAPDNVWSEGTAGVAVARAKAGDSAGAGQVVDQLAPLQTTTGSLPYALVDDAATSMTTQQSVAATGWFVLANLGATSIW